MTDQGEELGTLDDVLTLPANDVFVVYGRGLPRVADDRHLLALYVGIQALRAGPEARAGGRGSRASSGRLVRSGSWSCKVIQ